MVGAPVGDRLVSTGQLARSVILDIVAMRRENFPLSVIHSLWSALTSLDIDVEFARLTPQVVRPVLMLPRVARRTTLRLAR